MKPSFLLILLTTFCSLFFGCALNPPINTVPEFGHYEKSHMQSEADQQFVYQVRLAQKKDPSLDPVKYYIDNGFNALKQGQFELAVKRLNQAWLLDSLAPDIYLGFAIAELQDNNAKSAIKYYEKYRTFAAERPTLPTQDTLETAGQGSTIKQAFIYGKLISLNKNDNDYWPSQILANEHHNTSVQIEKSKFIPENEKTLFTNRTRATVVFAKIQVQQYFNDSTKQWMNAPADSVYDFWFVEHQGLFPNEEHQCLAKLGETSTPDSSSRIFEIKPYAFFDDPQALESYSKPISENELASIDPSTIERTPYQKKEFIKPPFNESIRSKIAHALSVGDLDSIRAYLTKAKELELLYGNTVLSNFEYVQIAALDVDAFADSILWDKAQSLSNFSGFSQTYKDTLELLAIYRSYPHIYADSFYSQLRKYPKGHYLVKATRRPFLNSSKIILDNRIAARIFIGPTIRFYDDKSAKTLGSKAIGANANLEFCFIRGCLGFGGGATAPIGHKTKFIYKDQEYQRSSSDFDGSMQVHLGARPLLRETFDIELYGLMNLSTYATNNENSQAVAALDFGFGIAFTSALFTFRPLLAPKSQANFNVRIKGDYLWNRTPSKCKGPNGHVLALSIQIGMGGSSYRFEEESSNPQGRTFREEWARLDAPNPSGSKNVPTINNHRVSPHH